MQNDRSNLVDPSSVQWELKPFEPDEGARIETKDDFGVPKDRPSSDDLSESSDQFITKVSSSQELERVVGLFSGARDLSLRKAGALRHTVWHVVITTKGEIYVQGTAGPHYNRKVGANVLSSPVFQTGNLRPEAQSYVSRNAKKVLAPQWLARYLSPMSLVR